MKRRDWPIHTLVWQWLTKEWQAVALLVVVVLIAYSNIFGNLFVWDDGYFVDWPGYQPGQVDWSGIFSGKVPMSYGQVYRPLRGVWYVLSVGLTHKNVVWLHVQGVMTHGVIVLMVYYLVGRLTGHQAGKLKRREKRWWLGVPMVTALLFAVHPLHTEAVSFITASFDTIGIALMFGALCVHTKWLETKKQRWLKWEWGLTAGAFLSYELTFVYAGLVVVWDWAWGNWRRQESLNHGVKVVGLIVLYLVIKSAVLPTGAGKVQPLFASFEQNLAFTGVLVGQYLRYMWWPYLQSINHEIYPGVSNFLYANDGGAGLPTGLQMGSRVFWLPVMGFLAGILAVWWWGRREKLVWLGGLWALLSLAPVLQIVPLYSVFAERYTYIATFGVCLVAALGLKVVGSRLPKWGYGLVVIALVVGLGWMTWQRNKVWATTVTLWENAVATGYESAYAYRNLGASYYIDHDYGRAIEAYLQAERLASKDWETYNKLVYLYRLSGDEVRAQGQMKLAEERGVRR